MASIEPEIMLHLPWPVLPYYSTVGAGEPYIAGLRERLQAAVQHAIAPVLEYQGTYSIYDALLALDVDGYIADLEAKGEDLTLADLKAEINTQMAELEVMEQSIPSGHITVGAVVLNTNQVYQYLVGKKQRMVKELKMLLARIPKKMMTAVNNKFQELEKSIKQKPSCIEDIDDLRKMIENLPSKVLEMAGAVEDTKVRGRGNWASILLGRMYVVA